MKDEKKDTDPSQSLAGLMLQGLSPQRATIKLNMEKYDALLALDVLRANPQKALLSEVAHADIVSVGKTLAWGVLQEIMMDPKAPVAQRVSAAKWTLEAAGEGIGATRAIKRGTKRLTELSKDELEAVISQSRQLLDSTIDLEPEKDLAVEFFK